MNAIPAAQQNGSTPRSRRFLILRGSTLSKISVIFASWYIFICTHLCSAVNIPSKPSQYGHLVRFLSFRRALFSFFPEGSRKPSFDFGNSCRPVLSVCRPRSNSAIIYHFFPLLTSFPYILITPSYSPS